VYTKTDPVYFYKIKLKNFNHRHNKDQEGHEGNNLKMTPNYNMPEATGGWIRQDMKRPQLCCTINFNSFR
jgi:hypothetical protein